MALYITQTQGDKQMNYQFAFVGGLTVLALVAHVFGGIRQSLSLEPAKLADKAKLAACRTSLVTH